MKLAMYSSNGFKFCVMTKPNDENDIKHIEQTLHCKFVKWMEKPVVYETVQV